jgi:hypothetical protein
MDRRRKENSPMEYPQKSTTSALSISPPENIYLQSSCLTQTR